MKRRNFLKGLVAGGVVVPAVKAIPTQEKIEPAIKIVKSSEPATLSFGFGKGHEFVDNTELYMGFKLDLYDPIQLGNFVKTDKNGKLIQGTKEDHIGVVIKTTNSGIDFDLDGLQEKRGVVVWMNDR